MANYLRTRPRAFVLSLALVIAALAIIVSAAAEAFAILALYNGYAYQYADVTVLSALLMLTVGTALLILARIAPDCTSNASARRRNDDTCGLQLSHTYHFSRRLGRRQG
jgi:hypothetical protein